MKEEPADFRSCRFQLFAYTIAASFLANIIGALFANWSDLFYLKFYYSGRLLLWMNLPPFLLAVILYLIYLAPLLKPSAALDLFRSKILKLPLFFLMVTSLSWGLALFQSTILTSLAGGAENQADQLLAGLGTLGIGLVSSLTGYYLLELINRRYWLPRLFQNRLEKYRGLFQPSLGTRFFINYLGISLAPLIIFLWIFTWTALKTGIYSRDQYIYSAFFLAFLLLSGLAITFFFSKMFQIPLIEAKEALEKISRGDYSISLSVRSNDELGVLSEGINNMAFSLEENRNSIALLNREIELTQREVVFTMGSIGESRSKETGNHVRRVAEYSRLLALLYGLDEEAAEILKQASPMHDIGKVAIPDSILNKPGKLTAEEYDVMKTHTVLGSEMLGHSERKLLKTAAILALEHHEKMDGTGYPRGLSGDEIHIFGRITALADVFDALGSDRVYKKAWKDEQIFELFHNQRHLHFDADLIDLFFRNLQSFLNIRQTFSDN